MSGQPSAEMRYTADGYFKRVVRGAKAQLVGWPAGIPFGNASNLKGGGAVTERLLRELESGRMHFRRVSSGEAERIATAQITPEKCLPARARRGRSDVMVHRLRRVRAPLYVSRGPKTPEMVDSDDEEMTEGETAARVEAAAVVGAAAAARVAAMDEIEHERAPVCVGGAAAVAFRV